MDIKEEIDGNTVIVGDFNIPLSSKDRSSRQKINTATVTLNDTLDQMDLIDNNITFYPKAEEHTFFSSAQRIFTKRDHALGHRISVNKFKTLKSYQASSLTTML